MNAIPLIKFLGAWTCIVAAVVLLVLGHPPIALPGVLGILAVAFAQAPTSWA